MVKRINIFTILIGMILLINCISSLDYPSTQITISYSGNLTNLSDLLDVNIPAPNDNDVLSYDDGTSKWVSSPLSLSETLWNANFSNFTVVYGYALNASSSGISWATAVNGTLAELADILGWSYYNATNFNITDYLTSAQILGFSYYNSTNAPVYLNDTFAANYSNFTVVYGYATNGSGIDWADAVNGTLMLAANWNATNTSYYLETNPFGFYNSTDFDIADYSTTATILGWSYYNSTNPPPADAETLWNANYSNFTVTYGYAINSSDTDTFVANYSTFLTHIDWAKAVNGTLASMSDVLGYGYYNATNFNITDYSTSSLINDTIGIYNTSMKAYVDANIGGITWADVVNGTLAQTATILGYGYYNATNFNITDYSTTATMIGYGYYNSTNAPIYKNDTFATNYTNFTVIYGYALNATGISWAEAINGTLASMADILGFSYYNSTNAPIYKNDTFAANYTNFTTVYGYNSTMKAYVDAMDTSFNNSMKAYVDANIGGITWADAINGTLAQTSTILGWSYYNVTNAPIYLNDTFAANYSNFTTIYAYNSTMKAYVDAMDTSFNDSMKAYVDANIGGITWADVVNGTMASWSDIIAQGYYNSTDFNIADYSTTATILGWSYYNVTNAPIYLNDTFAANYSDYLVIRAYALNSTGISWAEAINGTLAQTSTILGFNYYNSTNAPIYKNDTFAGNYSNFTAIYSSQVSNASTRGYALNNTLTQNMSMAGSTNYIINGTGGAYIYHNGTGWVIKG